MKNDTSLFSLRNIKIMTNMQKKKIEILVQTALTVGLFWTILKLPLSPHYCPLLYCNLECHAL
jgi:hypothetical protein